MQELHETPANGWSGGWRRGSVPTLRIPGLVRSLRPTSSESARTGWQLEVESEGPGPGAGKMTPSLPTVLAPVVRNRLSRAAGTLDGSDIGHLLVRGKSLRSRLGVGVLIPLAPPLGFPASLLLYSGPFVLLAGLLLCLAHRLGLPIVELPHRSETHRLCPTIRRCSSASRRASYPTVRVRPRRYVACSTSACPSRAHYRATRGVTFRSHNAAMTKREPAWDAVHEALPAGWTVAPPMYDPGVSGWSVTARTVAPPRRKPPVTVTGTGPDEAAALRALDDRLRGVPQPGASRMEARAADQARLARGSGGAVPRRDGAWADSRRA